MTTSPSEPTAEFSTLVELLRWRALHQPDRRAYTFLVDGEEEEVHLTYEELDRQARAIGALLQSQEATGKRVLLLYPPGLEFIAAFFGCLYAEVMAVPVYPPDPARLDRTLPRLRAIANDAQASAALTTSPVLSMVKDFLASDSDFPAMRWLATDNVAGNLAEEWQDTGVSSNTLVFLQYTAGSTAVPKGVMVSHGNFLRNVAYIDYKFEHTLDSVIVTWLPHFHDMGLVYGIIQPLYKGVPCFLMSPVSFIQRPIRWLQAISRYKATHSGGPNFAYDLCARKITPGQHATLDLSSWCLAFNGAEPIRKDTLERFAEAFEPCGFHWSAFHPCYGLAEATLMVSGGLKTDPPVFCTVQGAALEKNRVVESSEGQQSFRTLVSSGRSTLDTKTVIVDPESLTQCPPDQIGEIWVSGPSVAQGYWNRPEETEHTFRAYLAGTGEGPFLRTGDLGFLKDGELFVTGRIKDLIIIRGQNHYPQDIELTAERSHPSLRPGSCAAFSVDVASEERLVVVAEVDRRYQPEGSLPLDVEAVVGAVRQAVAEQHELQVHAVSLLKARTVPKTSSGKIQRRACRDAFLAGSLEVVGEWRGSAKPDGDIPDASADRDSREPGDFPRELPTAEVIESWLVAQLSSRLGVGPGDIDVCQPFALYGLDSKEAVSLAGDLENLLDRSLPATLAWDYPTIESLARHLAGEPDVSALPSRVSTDRATVAEPIAIIGLGCRFPGAEDPEAFWRLLRDGVDAITEVPADRWDVDAFYDPDPAIPGKMNTRWGGFLEQVDQFDPQFFGIAPREAIHVDPQQRLLLEVAWEALEDAGQVPERLTDARAGVFIGISTNDYGWIQLSDPAAIDDAYPGTGNASSIAANRLSYLLDLRGPSIAVDTACSSSLVAVHLACQSLWNGESTVALAGGVNVILSPAGAINFTKAGAMAPDGRCKAFDARANGYVRSEGAGIVILKPLSSALAEGDPIYAVISGSAINQDGRTNGIMAPSRWSQEAMLREAYRRAGVSPGQVQYVEAHGTGTFLGDPIEAKALGTVLAVDRPAGSPCAIGSVKTNIGHLEAAAGIASLVKVALMLKQRLIPPSLHFEEPNPHIPFDELSLRVVQTLRPWPEESSPALAGVSSFGFGGTNAHVVVEEAPPIPGHHKEKPASGLAYLLPLSARSPEALQALARAYQDFLAAEGSGVSLRDICYTASVRRSHHDFRLAFVGHSCEEFAEHLEAFLQEEARTGLSSGRKPPGRRRKLVFVFPGQGPKWWPLDGKLLEQEPIFRASLERCDELMRQHADWSLLRELTADEAKTRLNETDITQPALFAIQVALAALWRSWGIEPDAVVGHSMGEVTAAHVAGALTLEDAVRVISHRGRLIKRVTGQGKMAVVELSLEQAQGALAGYEDRLSIAASNGPTSTALSGEPAALEEVLASLQQKDIFCRLLESVDFASHSPQMEPLQNEFERALEGLQHRPSSLPIYSTVTGAVGDGLAFDPNYWARNLREPVLFSTALGQLLDNGHDIFLELSPHPILLAAVSQCLHARGEERAVLPSLRREEEGQAVMLESLGALYTLGYPVDWSRLYPSGGRSIRLPSYPWQRERCWLDDQGTREGRVSKRSYARHGGGRALGHPLLGERLKSAVHPGTYFWEMDLGTDLFPYLKDHLVQEAVTLPAAAYVEMALAASREAFGPGPHVLEKVAFKKVLVLPEDGAQTVQLVISPEMPGTASLQVFSLQAGDEEQQASWTLHATAAIRLGEADPAASPAEHASPEEIQARCLEVVSGAEHYQALQERGLQYGPSFQGVEQIWRRDGEAIGQLRLTERVEREAGAYQIHPALLDACFHVLAATLPGEDAQIAEEDTYVPVGLGSLRVYDRPRPGIGLWSHALLRPAAEANAGTLEGDVFLLDENGQVMLEVLGLSLRRLDRDVERTTQGDISDWLYGIQWQPEARLEQDQTVDPLPPEQRCGWLIFADSSGVGQTMRSLLEARDQACVMVSPGETYKIAEPGHYQLNPARPEEFRQLLGDAFGSGQPACRAVVHLWSLEAAAPEETTLTSLEATQTLGCGSVLHLVQALAQAGWRDAPRLWLVTQGAQAVGGESEVAVAQSPLWGLGRVIAHEHSDLRCTTVDLSPVDTPGEVQSLFAELWTDGHEDQITLRGDARYVERLVQCSPGSLQATTNGSSLDGRRPFDPERDQNFRLETSAPGILDNLTLRVTARRKPGPGEVEIQVCTAGLNSMDIMNALGLLSGGPLPLGAECAGTVVAVGEGAEDFQPGDEVIAIAPFSFSAFLTVSNLFVVPKLAHLGFHEAATIPIAFLTAYYALHHLGRLGEGERVLIHAAAGDVGLAAVQLARRAGAEIFATAGTPEKREFLKGLGIPHVMDSRSLDFADEVLRLTDGEGVDVVLNSLAGEALNKSLSILAPYGRFLEIGKRDIQQNSPLGLRPFQNNLSFFAIDPDRVCRERPLLIRSLFRELMRCFEDGTLSPLPIQTFPISKFDNAFRHMAQAKHIGKIVVFLQDQDVLVAPASEAPVSFRSDSTYLITGGLGSLGLTAAQWMVKEGARHLVLMGRKEPSAAAQQEALEAMREAGAQVVIAKADVTQERQVANVFAEIDQSMPPLRGIIHAAGILDDGILLRLDQERFRSVMAPKIAGAWNLHTLSLEKPLDFFVLFSSAASLLGSPGQGSYSAANAFLDSLAHHRRAQGLPALSINWGPWAEVGLAARPDRGGRLALRGIAGIRPEQGVEALGRLLCQGATQVGVMPLDLRQWRQFYPKAAASPLFARLAREEGGSDGSKKEGSPVRKAFLDSEPGRRRSLLEHYLQEQIAQVLMVSPTRIEGHTPLDTLGLDSIMALELRNRLEASLGVTLPATLVWGYPTITALAPHLARKMGIPLESAAEVGSDLQKDDDERADEEIDRLLTDTEQLSEAEVRTALDIEKRVNRGDHPVGA